MAMDQQFILTRELSTTSAYGFSGSSSVWTYETDPELQEGTCWTAVAAMVDQLTKMDAFSAVCTVASLVRISLV